jgi:renalase
MPGLIREVIVVGAGVSGLALARELQSQGRAPVVLERARGVGGRCATRRLDGQPVDHGPAFLHGRTERFIAEMDAVRDVVAILDWPHAREGSGAPCQPQAFDGRSRRLAFAEGVSCFPKHLARGLDVRLEANVTALGFAADPSSAAGGCWTLTLASGETLRARAVALTMPAPSASALLQAMTPLPASIAAVLPLLGLVRTLACLTVIARYPAGTTAPAWQASFPRSSAAVHTILHDSSKRAGAARLVLVIQARPGFSRAHLDDPAESWARALLEEAAAIHGAWIARPEVMQSHVWRKARVDPGSELARPIAIQLDGGAALGVAGDGFHPAGGVEGAYLSGIALAPRLAELLPRRT